jgi:stage II sporulation protein D
MLRRFLFTFIFLAFCSSIDQANAVPVVSVRIGKGLRNIHVTGMDLKRNLLFANDVKTYTGKKTVKFNCQTFTTLNKERNKPILLATLESSTGLLSYENTKYQGLFKVVTNPKGDSCDIINDVPMEAYIASLLTKEMNPNWPLEALKAQAVAARSYAYHKMLSQQVTKELGNEAFYDLESSEKHQVGGSFFDATDTTLQAAAETKGEVLTTENGAIRPVFFHAKCGGRTLRPDQVWKNFEPGYQSVNCPFCHDIGPKGWTKFVSFDRLKSFFRWAQEKNLLREKMDGTVSSIVLVPDSIDKANANFYVNERPFIIEKGAIRRYFGNVLFPSNSFSLSMRDGNLVISGEGLGHNVGMCQMGAFALAKRGWSYKRILVHYFPGHYLKKMY